MEPTQTEVAPVPATNQPLETPAVTPVNKSQKSKSQIIGIATCAVLAVAGIAFGVYEFMDSNQKSQQISNLKAEVENKTAEVTNLETEISNLNAKINETTTESNTSANDPESKKATQAGTASIILGDILDENETRTVFTIGQCTADGPSVKCPITTANGEALISFLTTDNVLRLSLPKD